MKEHEEQLVGLVGEVTRKEAVAVLRFASQRLAEKGAQEITGGEPQFNLGYLAGCRDCAALLGAMCDVLLGS